MHDVALIAAISLLLPFERLAICALKLIANDHYVAFTEHYSDMVSNVDERSVHSLIFRLLIRLTKKYTEFWP